MTSDRDPTEQCRDGDLLAFVTCTISGDKVIPDFWTGYFVVEPDIAVEKDRPFKTPSGRVSPRPGRTGVWGISTKLAVREDELIPHLKYLISHLRLPRPDLPRLLQASEAQMRFLCYWANYSGDRQPAIDPELRILIESSGGIIEIDEYP